VGVNRREDTYQAVINGESTAFVVLEQSSGQISLIVAGKPAIVEYASNPAGLWLSLSGCTYLLEKPAPRRAASGEADQSGVQVHSPMPAQVRSVQVTTGDEVQKGQVLMLLEAMKMEIRIKASSSGKLTNLPVQAGQTVVKDQLLAVIEIRKPR
jgi:acetyl/propionyl-CoA carboxylase alpha subunit